MMKVVKYYFSRILEKIAIQKAKDVHKQLINTHQRANISPFFIISAGRSGSTLLRKMLMQGGDIHIPPESYDCIPRCIKTYSQQATKAWPQKVKSVIRIFKNDSCFKFWSLDLPEQPSELLNLEKDDQTLYSILNFIYSEHAKKYTPNYKIYGDKTPYLNLRLDWLTIMFSQAKYICLVRDGRDVIASSLKMNKSTLDLTINRWIVSMKAIETLKSKVSKEKILQIKYEDLVGDPQKILKQVSSFLNVDYKDKMALNSDINLGDDKQAHHKNLARPVNTKSIGNWKQQFTLEEQNYINSKLNRYLLKYDYQL